MKIEPFEDMEIWKEAMGLQNLSLILNKYQMLN